MPLCDREIAALCDGPDPLISPFASSKMGYPSYGLSASGYDLRLAPRAKLLAGGVVDPRDPDATEWGDVEGGAFTIPPGGFLLGHAVERLHMPPNVMARVESKSTYARCGVITHVTVVEAGWRGYLTIEVSNTAPVPAVVYANAGICQVVFERIATPATTYAGRYQDQKAEVTLPREQ